MRREQLIEAFKPQVDLAPPGQAFQVFYVTQHDPMPHSQWLAPPAPPFPTFSIRVNMVVYDLTRLEVEFADHLFLGMHKNSQIPLFDKITPLIP